MLPGGEVLFYTHRSQSSINMDGVWLPLVSQGGMELGRGKDDSWLKNAEGIK